MTARVATTVWRLTPELMRRARRAPRPAGRRLRQRHPDLAHRPTAPADETLEWRLHPVSGFRPPKGVGPYDLWDEVTGQLAAGADPASLPLGEERRPLASLWDGLECYPVDDPLEPAPLAAAATTALGIAPDASGLVDHERIGSAWERAKGSISIIALLLEELHAPVEGA